MNITDQDRQNAIQICDAGAASASGTYEGFAIELAIEPKSIGVKLAIAAWLACRDAQPRDQDAEAAALLRRGWAPSK